MAAAAIWDRHRKADDQDLWRLTEVMDDLPKVIDYVARHYHPLGDGERAADALDCLVIIRWQQRQLDLRTLNMITLARKWKAPWTTIAQALGLNSRQAAEQVYLRLRAWAAPLQEGLSTAGRRSETERRLDLANRRASGTDPEVLVAYPSPRDPSPTTVATVIEMVRGLAAQHRDLPEDLVLDLRAVLESPNPANTLGLVRAVVADLVDRADELPTALVDLARDAAALLRR